MASAASMPLFVRSIASRLTASSGFVKAPRLNSGIRVVPHGEAVDAEPEVADAPGQYMRVSPYVVGKVQVEVGQTLAVAARSAICIIVGLPVRSGQNKCGAEPKELSRVAKRKDDMTATS